VSSEISGNLFQSFRKFVKYFFHFIIFNYNHIKNKHIFDKQVETTFKIRQNNLYLASLPRKSANFNENYKRYNFQALANISGNFRKIYNPNCVTLTSTADYFNNAQTQS